MENNDTATVVIPTTVSVEMGNDTSDLDVHPFAGILGGMYEGSSIDGNDTNSSSTIMAPPPKSMRDFYIGLFLACSSSVFIGTSFILKKKGLLRLSHRAGQGGYGYLKEWMWWAGMILMITGEGANFAAYAFAPATLVTPLGALSVLVSAVLASKLLKEKLNLLGKLGCLICVLGSTVIVIHSPKEQELQTMRELAEKLKDPGFITYAFVVLVCALVLIFYYSPRHGQTNPLIYISITGMIGSLTVMGCKGLGVAIKQTFDGHQQFSYWLTWFVIAWVVSCIIVQMNYLNKALDIFSTSVVTPILYVVFTTFVIIASAILFKEWYSLSPEDILGNICGFLTVVAGIFLVQAFKEMKVSLNNLPSAKRLESASSNGSVDYVISRAQSIEDTRTVLLDAMETQSRSLDDLTPSSGVHSFLSRSHSDSSQAPFSQSG